MSTRSSNPPAIVTKLKNFIKENTVTCTFNGQETQVLSEQAIAKIATLANIWDYTESTDIQKTPLNDRMIFTTKLVESALRLFVLAVAKDYPAGFLDRMIMRLEYTDPKDRRELFYKNTPVSKGDEFTKRKVIGHQSLVGAQKFKKGKYSHKLMEGTLPFRETRPNNAYNKDRFPGAKRGWDVVLDKEFQDGDFGGLTRFALTIQRRQPKPGDQYSCGQLAGFRYIGDCYILWESHAPSEQGFEVLESSECETGEESVSCGEGSDVSET